MHFEEFAEGSSLIHRLDPRAKIISVFLLTLVIALSKDGTAILAGFLFSLGLIMVARLEWRKVLSRLLVVNGFFLFLLVILSLTVPGAPLSRIGPFTVTGKGLTYGATLALKGNAMYGAMIALLGTSSIVQLGHALHHLHLPQKLVQLFFFSYRYISVLHDEYHRIRRSLKIRGFQAKTDLHTYRTYGYIIGMLFINSYDRSQRIYRAMLCRGFRGELRTINHFEMGRNDLLFLLVHVLFAVSLAAFQVIK